MCRHPYLPSPIKKFVLRNSLKIFGSTRSWDWERFRDQSFSIAGEEGWGILVETHSFKAKLKCQSSPTEYKEGTPKNWLPISCQSIGGLLEYYRIVCSTRDQVNLIVTQTVSPPLPPTWEMMIGHSGQKKLKIFIFFENVLMASLVGKICLV